MHHVFVYGTLKEGFANFGINAGTRVPGVFRTVQSYPLYIMGEAFLPWLVNQPGRGEHVIGQVFQVNEQVLRDMDALEQIDEDGWYARIEIEVQEVSLQDAQPVRAFVYFGSSERLSREPVHAGPLAQFTSEHNTDYVNAK